MTAILENFVVGPAQLLGLAAVALVALALALLGAFIGGRERMAEADPVFGWAAVSVLFTLIGVATRIPFTIVLYGVLAAAAAAGVAAWRRDGRVGAAGWWKLILLAAPLILLVAAMSPSQWDEFTQWLPNARFLFEHDAFPRLGLAKSPSTFPAYPPGLSLLIYMASRIAGHLVENAGALFNLVLVLSFGLLVVRLITMARATPGSAPVPGPGVAGWGIVALGGLAVTMLNPTFVPKVVFTAYADAATAITVGLTGILGWQMLNALALGQPARVRALAWQTTLVATALVNIKQVNLVHFAILMAALLLVAMRDRRIALGRVIKLVLWISAMPLVLYVVWRFHVTANISGGEFAIRPPSQWFVGLIPDVLARMALIGSKKGVYFGLMVVAMVFGGRAMLDMRSEFDRLAVIMATAFILYNGFLLFSYIAVFSEYDALRAASYWRYNMHLGALAVAFAAYGLALL